MDSTKKPPAEHQPEEAVLPIVFSGPAPYANKIYVSVAPSGVARVSFLEFPIGSPPGVAPEFRVAVLLSVQDLWSLKVLIESMISVEEKPSEGAPDGQ